MFSSWGRPREVQTSIPCSSCGKALMVGRTWHDVSLWCTSCGKKLSLEEGIPLMDDAMEDFLENVYCDRM